MDAYEGPSAGGVFILPWLDKDEDRHHMKNRHFWTF
jgi:hypothetical protein